jgi:hypothetical protein
MSNSSVFARPSVRILGVAVISAALAVGASSWHAAASPRARSLPSTTATPAKAYVGRFNASTDKVLSKKQHLITSTPKLPAGNYLVNASVSLAMYGQNGTQCYVRTAKGNTSGKGQAEETQTPTGTSGINADLSITDAFTKIVNDDKIELICRDYAEGSDPTKVNSGEVNALPVGILTTKRS